MYVPQRRYRRKRKYIFKGKYFCKKIPYIMTYI
jgi:hypothetical protein